MFIGVLLFFSKSSHAAALQLVHESTGNLQNVTVKISSITTASANVTSTFTLSGMMYAGGISPINKMQLQAVGVGFAPQWSYSGNLLQISSFTVSASSATTATTFVNTNVTLNFTPISTTSVVMVHVFGNIYNNTGGSGAILSVKRGSTDISPGGLGFCENTATALIVEPCSITWPDIPATTAQQTYTVTIRVAGAGTASFGGGYISTGGILLMEFGTP